MIFKLLKGNQLRISIQKVLVMNPLDYLLRLTSTVSAPFLDRTLKKLSSNRKINYLLNRLETKRLQKIDEVKKILIIPDINIGDAVIAQSFISPIKNSFPARSVAASAGLRSLTSDAYADITSGSCVNSCVSPIPTSYAILGTGLPETTSMHLCALPSQIAPSPQ